MRKLYRFVVLLGILALAGAGCEEGMVSGDNDFSFSKERPVNVYQLAESLGLTVADTTATDITLKNSANTVMIFTHTGGRFFVNGKACGEVGETENVRGTFFFPQSLVSKIAASLVTARPTVTTTTRLSGTIVIDAGHGGRDPGAVGRNGSHEKNINLGVARKVASALRRKGFKVVMTRTGDSFIELNDRANIANRNNCDLFVSLHCDSFPDSSRKGFAVYIARSASSGSRSAARSVIRSMSATGRTSHGMQKADYRVLVRTNCPAILIEMGYLSNYYEASQLATSKFQNQATTSIVKGICDYLGRR